MTSRIFSKWSGAPFEISLGCRYELLVRVLDFLSYVAVVSPRHFWPFFSPLAPFLVLLTGILGGVDRLLPPAAPILAKVMAALTGSLPEACHVAKSSNSLVVCGCSRPSS
jgi:hypothetical protein